MLYRRAKMPAIDSFVAYKGLTEGIARPSCVRVYREDRTLPNVSLSRVAPILSCVGFAPRRKLFRLPLLSCRCAAARRAAVPGVRVALCDDISGARVFLVVASKDVNYRNANSIALVRKYLHAILTASLAARDRSGIGSTFTLHCLRFVRSLEISGGAEVDA